MKQLIWIVLAAAAMALWTAPEAQAQCYGGGYYGGHYDYRPSINVHYHSGHHGYIHRPYSSYHYYPRKSYHRPATHHHHYHGHGGYVPGGHIGYRSGGCGSGWSFGIRF